MKIFNLPRQACEEGRTSTCVDLSVHQWSEELAGIALAETDNDNSVRREVRQGTHHSKQWILESTSNEPVRTIPFSRDLK